ncbi:hypothetical protein [Allofustis seminis]|uniref:hypothetical protein n=1 Tax=Allofustis seminis TaxID=166939 RepID=UPI00037D412C|nr:hypothetical protein [Allofustis seminis]
MEQLTQLSKAHHTIEEVLEHIDLALQTLSSAKSYGMWDIFLNSIFFSGLKRDKIKVANHEIQAIEPLLRELQQELTDVTIDLPAEISDTFWGHFLDIWVDNPFTDLRVQREIKKTVTALETLRYNMQQLLEQINDKIAHY